MQRLLTAVHSAQTPRQPAGPPERKRPHGVCTAGLQMRRSGEAQDPPDLEGVRAFARTLPDAMPLLQAELQPVSARIGQVSIRARLTWAAR